MSIDLLILGRKKNAREKNKSWSPKFFPSFTCLLQTRWTCWLSRNSRRKRPNLSSLSNCFPSFWSPPWCNHQCPTTYGLNIPLLDSGPLGSRQKKRTHGEWLETWSVTIVRGLAPLNTHNYGTPISWASGILDRLRPNKRMRQGSSWVDTHTHTQTGSSLRNQLGWAKLANCLSEFSLRSHVVERLALNRQLNGRMRKTIFWTLITINGSRSVDRSTTTHSSACVHSHYSSRLE